MNGLAPDAGPRALPVGTRLRGEFEIVRVLHDGGFGIDYLADDLAQNRRVVIKEYLPRTLATRAPGGAVVVNSIKHAAVYQEGLKGFAQEARLLVAFDRPALVSMLKLWKENGTAYMVLQYTEGASLRSRIADCAPAPAEPELRAWLERLLDTLETLHAARCVHGHVNPGSIVIGPQGPVLLGFGGGRHAIARALRMPSDALDPGYAAIEQYGADPALAEGPWTDLYALAAVVYTLLTGQTPSAAPVRRASNALTPLREFADGHYSDSLIAAVDAALGLRPAERPQDVAAFRAMLTRAEQRPPAAPPAFELDTDDDLADMDTAASTSDAAPRVSKRRKAVVAAITAACVLGFGVLAFMATRSAGELSQPSAPTGNAAPLDPAPSRAASRGDDASPTPFSADANLAPLASPSNRPSAPALPTDRKRSSTTSTTPPTAPARTAAARARCSDLLQRASLDTLTRDEAATLKRECR